MARAAQGVFAEPKKSNWAWPFEWSSYMRVVPLPAADFHFRAVFATPKGTNNSKTVRVKTRNLYSSRKANLGQPIEWSFYFSWVAPSIADFRVWCVSRLLK